MSLGIYLHIPFCKQKCLYCDFNSYAGKESLMDTYCQALKKEISAYATEEMVDTVYFGGGTPTVLGAERLIKLLRMVRKNVNLTEDCEITVECNPGTIDKEGLLKLYQAGFNRLSIGLQSTEDEMLKSLGRIHTFQDFRNCFRDAREIGFTNLSLDLMYGLPGQSLQEWQNTLQEAISFCPEHLSCYGLKVEEGTPFASMKLSLPDDDAVREMYDTCVDTLQKAGYGRYEISNFAKPGYESRHNLKYWHCDDFIGLGAGAYSCVDGVRYYNISGIPEYCQAIAERKSAVKEEISLSEQELMSEFCFLGLRTAEGIGVEEFKNRFWKELTDVFGKELSLNLDRGTMWFENGRYRIAPDFFFVSNTILADFV